MSLFATFNKASTLSIINLIVITNLKEIGKYKERDKFKRVENETNNNNKIRIVCIYKVDGAAAAVWTKMESPGFITLIASDAVHSFGTWFLWFKTKSKSDFKVDRMIRFYCITCMPRSGEFLRTKALFK